MELDCFFNSLTSDSVKQRAQPGGISLSGIFDLLFDLLIVSLFGHGFGTIA
ncbi:hypothetical protein pah_c039o005 [Parachlamydia acanthamoebae str. Hall's coccus]|nr:hypothetical protein pah_c039o005 [Parachlamydia acanthamoebae str. Hall's coccus]